MEERRKVFAVIEHVLSASANISGEVEKRLKQVAALFGFEGQGKTVHFDPKAKAS
jgi:hypothetical protein